MNVMRELLELLREVGPAMKPILATGVFAVGMGVRGAVRRDRTDAIATWVVAGIALVITLGAYSRALDIVEVVGTIAKDEATAAALREKAIAESKSPLILGLPLVALAAALGGLAWQRARQKLRERDPEDPYR